MANKPDFKRFPATFFILLLAAAAIFFSLSSAAAEGKKLDIILITAGSLRPSHLSSYGYEHIKTPSIDGIAKDGILFKNAYCNVPDARYGFASILTGMDPNRVISRKGDLLSVSDKTKLLGALLKENGYATGAVVSSSFLAPENALLKNGFDTFENILMGLPQEQFVSRAGLVTERSLEAAKTLKAQRKPVFLWAEYSVPEYPYLVPDDFQEAQDDFFYDRQVLYLDQEVGKLLAGLKKLGIENNAIVIFSAATGEGLDEHSEPLHGIFIYNSAVKVPLIIKIPGAGAGERSAYAATLSDIAPTLLDSLGIKSSEGTNDLTGGFDGISLLRRTGSKEKDGRAVYLTAVSGYIDYGWSPLAGIILNGYKYIEAPKVELYDLNNDPHELKNIVLQEPQKTAQMRAGLVKHLEKNDPGLLAILKKGPDPKEVIGVLKTYFTGMSQLKGADQEKIIIFYRDLLAKDPTNKRFLFALANLFMAANKPHMTEYYLLELAEKYPESTQVWELLGNAYDRQKKTAEAINAYKKAIAITPDSVFSMNNLAWDYAKSGTNLEEALALAQKANTLVPSFPAFMDTLAQVYLKMGNTAKAVETMQRAVLLDPNSVYLKKQLEELVKPQ